MQDDSGDFAAIDRIRKVQYHHVILNLERQRERRDDGVEKDEAVAVNGKMLRLAAPNVTNEEREITLRLAPSAGIDQGWY